MAAEVKSSNWKVFVDTLSSLTLWWYFLEPVQSEMFDSFSCQMKKLETKMATMNEDKDKRIVELQAHNNDLFNKLEEFEDRYNNQLDVSRSLLLN